MENQWGASPAPFEPPQCDPWAGIYFGYAIMLEERFRRYGGLENLENAILNYEKAIKYADPDHKACRSKFYRRLEDARILFHEKTARLTPNNLADTPAHHYKLGDALLERFVLLGELQDLDNAILSLQKSVELTPYGHPDRENFSSRLSYGYKQRKRIEEERLEKERLEKENIEKERLKQLERERMEK
ncbi:hypothetical protein FRC19_001256, partial [Serendipita sp. 401]